MIRKFPGLVALLCCLLSGHYATAQPGGGGGLHIIRLFDRNWHRLLSADCGLHIRAFALKNGLPYQENFYRSPGYIPDTQCCWSPRYLQPQERFDLYSVNHYPATDQRMMITYRQDTMLIDFLGITGENGMGYQDVLDTVVVVHGHYRYNVGHMRTYYHRLPALVPGAAGSMNTDTAIQYLGRPDAAFLKEASWGADFFLSYARHLVAERSYADALAAVNKGVRMAGGAPNCPALLILSDAYAGLKRYDEALASLKEGIYCTMGRIDGLRRNIERGAALAWMSGRPAKGLEFYALLIRNADSLQAYERSIQEQLHNYRPSFRALYEQAVYIDTAMHNEPLARRELQAIIDSMPRYFIGELADGSSMYGRVYFHLAGLEYKAGLRKAAYRHWLTGMEFQYGKYNDGANAQLFDRLIRADSMSPALYLARSLAHFQNPANRPGGYLVSLCDLDRAEQLDSSDYRIAMYRARIIAATGARDSALMFINQAIALAPDDPRLYVHRFYIEHPTLSDRYLAEWYPDLRQYHELCDRWHFKAYTR